MNNPYLYSIIIPHYSRNGTKDLLRAVESIPQRKDLQVIIVDNSPERIPCNLFSDRENVFICYSDTKKGAGHARNIGIEYAIGKWFLFLDADDFFSENAFYEFDRYKDTDFDIIFFNVTSCFSDTLKPARRHLSRARSIEKFLLGTNVDQLKFSEVPWAKMIKSSLVINNQIKFDEVKVCNDAIFGLKIGLTANKITADRAVVCCITISKGSLTNTKNQQNVETRFDVALRKNAILHQYGYKKTKSVIKFIIQDVKYGIIPTSRLLWRALKAGDLFIGWKNWLFTLYRIIFKSDNTASYQIEE